MKGFLKADLGGNLTCAPDEARGRTVAGRSEAEIMIKLIFAVGMAASMGLMFSSCASQGQMSRSSNAETRANNSAFAGEIGAGGFPDHAGNTANTPSQ